MPRVNRLAWPAITGLAHVHRVHSCFFGYPFSGANFSEQAERQCPFGTVQCASRDSSSTSGPYPEAAFVTSFPTRLLRQRQSAHRATSVSAQLAVVVGGELFTHRRVWLKKLNLNC